MNRLSNEDGISAGHRNIGRLALALIPWALGVGALAWLAFYVGTHQFRHELSQEERAATYVGAQKRPQNKMKIVVLKHDCSTVTRADLDGDALLWYARNDCHGRLDYFSWNWQLVSPDGTILKRDYTNWKCPTPAEPGESAECSMTIAPDDRAESIQIWTGIKP